jgi:PAS domain S-box-containing protein
MTERQICDATSPSSASERSLFSPLTSSPVETLGPLLHAGLTPQLLDLGTADQGLTLDALRQHNQQLELENQQLQLENQRLQERLKTHNPRTSLLSDLPLQVMPRAVFDAAPIPMILFVPQADRIVRTNRAASQLFGYGDQQLTGMHGLQIAPDLPWQEWCQAELPLNLATQRCCRFIKQGGENIWGKLTLTTIEDSQGHHLYWLVMIEDITQQRSSEIALAESEEKYRRLVENANDVIFTADWEGRFSYLSPKFTELTGYDVEEMLGQDFSPLCHPESTTDLLHLLADLAITQRPQRGMPLQIICKNGQVRWTEVNLSPILDDQGKLMAFQGIARDVTQTKRQEQDLSAMQTALTLSEEKHRNLVENASDTIFSMGLDGRFTYISPQFKQLTEYDTTEFLGKTSQGMDHPEDEEIPRNLIQTVVATGQSQVGPSFRLITKSGKIRWITPNVSPVCDGAGTVVEVQGVVRDVTLNKLQEERLLETQQQLIVAQEQLQHLLRSSPAVIYSAQVGEQPQLTFISDNISGLLGYRPQDCLAEDFWRAHLHPEDLPSFLASRLSPGRQGQLEYRVRHRDGRYRYLYDERQAVLDDQGRMIEVVGSLVDVSDRRDMENQLRASLAEKEVLLKEIHHRVKNNLQMVSSLLSLQANSIQDPKVLRPFQDSQNRVRAMAMVHEWLYQSDSLAQIDFAGYVTILVQHLERSYASSESQIELTCQVAEVEMPLDMSISCGLIIHELVSNALKYAFAPGMQGNIWVKCLPVPPPSPQCPNQSQPNQSQPNQSQPNQYQLIVGDDGVGLPEGLESHNASSLGLQLVSSFVYKMRGQMEVQRHPGTQFKIFFSIDSLL